MARCANTSTIIVVERAAGSERQLLPRLDETAPRKPRHRQSTDQSRMGGRWLLPLGLAGLVVRVLLLPLPGTLGVTVWKMWAFNAATTPVARLYGVGGDPPERAALRYDGRTTPVNYPPVALHVVGWVGRASAATSPSWTSTVARAR